MRTFWVMILCVLFAPSVSFSQSPRESSKNRLLVAELNDRYKAFNTPNTFKPGQFVAWKDGMKNRTVPAYGEPAIVMEVLKEPIVSDESESGSAYFREKLDLLLGVLDEDGDLIIYHYDGRRFEPYRGAGGAAL